MAPPLQPSPARFIYFSLHNVFRFQLHLNAFGIQSPATMNSSPGNPVILYNFYCQKPSKIPRSVGKENFMISFSLWKDHECDLISKQYFYSAGAICFPSKGRRILPHKFSMPQMGHKTADEVNLVEVTSSINLL